MAQDTEDSGDQCSRGGGYQCATDMPEESAPQDVVRSEFGSCGLVPSSCFSPFSSGMLAFRRILFLPQLVSLSSVFLPRKKVP